MWKLELTGIPKRQAVSTALQPRGPSVATWTTSGRFLFQRSVSIDPAGRPRRRVGYRGRDQPATNHWSQFGDGVSSWCLGRMTTSSWPLEDKPEASL